jgi:hypothetical protein
MRCATKNAMAKKPTTARNRAARQVGYVSARTYVVADEGSDTPSLKLVTNLKLTHYRAAKSLDRV